MSKIGGGAVVVGVVAIVTLAITLGPNATNEVRRHGMDVSSPGRDGDAGDHPAVNGRSTVTTPAEAG